MKEKKMEESNKAKGFKNTLNKEMALLKREERLENVQRIGKANEYIQLKIKQKIDFDQQRGEAL
jgi:hypothetical protein